MDVISEATRLFLTKNPSYIRRVVLPCFAAGRIGRNESAGFLCAYRRGHSIPFIARENMKSCTLDAISR
jgi:hypothetical protein